MDEKRINEISAALVERKAVLPCPRCGHDKFGIIEESIISIPSEKGFMIGGPGIPIVIIGCERCAYIMQHALGPIGMLPQKGGK
jgi:hypothetical protein